jgi:hypothetical protein
VSKVDNKLGDVWSAEASALLERAVARHGGWTRWRTIEEIGGRVAKLGGAIPAVKGLGRSFPPPGIAVVRPHAWTTRFVDYPEPGVDGIFAGGDVRLVSSGAGAGAILAESRRHRATFRGARKWRRWSPLDAIYFFGYALATYWSLPFVLERTTLVRADARSLTVDFPDELESHGRRQRFFFADDGLLVRHDYRAEILSSWATGTHLSDGYVDAGGLPLASRRRVVLRLGGVPLPVPILHAELADLVAR